MIRAILAVLVGLIASQSLVAQNDEFWPAMNSYKSMADYSRFYFQIQDSRENRQGRTAQIGPADRASIPPKYGEGLIPSR